MKNKKTSRRALGALAIGLAAAITAGMAAPAFGHGATKDPVSRSWFCAKGESSPWNPSTEACKDVVANSQSVLGDWQSVVQGDVWPIKTSDTPQYRAFIPDGKLCSANKPGFDALNNVHADWGTTTLTSGEDTVVTYNQTVTHQPYTFELYVTKDGWDSSKPLTWDALEQTPFLIADSPAAGKSGNDLEFQMPVSLPQGKDGKHMIYTIWRGNLKKDGSRQSTEAFFSCSDVVFQ